MPNKSVKVQSIHNNIGNEYIELPYTVEQKPILLNCDTPIEEDLQRYLEAVKSKTEVFDWKKVSNRLFEVCENETGSFKIQEIFNSGTWADKREIFETIKDKIPLMIVNKFGNYVIQKIIEKCPRVMKEQIVNRIKDNFAELCLN